MIKSTEQKFVLKSEYKPTGDQPQAIEALVKGFEEGNQCQTDNAVEYFVS